MLNKFHINQHGVPVICRDIDCHFDINLHFNSYDEAKRYLDKLNKEFQTKTPFDENDILKKIKSYYNSYSAVNEFPLNRKLVDLEDFDLMMITWLSKAKVRDKMKENIVGKAKFTYGDIVRMMNEEVKDRYNKELEIGDKYYNPIPYDVWEDNMKAQKNIYNNTISLTRELNFETMEVIYLPKSTRKCLEQDGYLMNANNIHEVIYKVEPAISQFGNIVAYNHSVDKLGKEFDIFEVAGAVEGKTIYDLCYSKRLEIEFEEMWNSSQFANKEESIYKKAVNRFKDEQFYKGIEGLDIPRILVKMSPVVAKEISRFIKNYRGLMLAVSEILIDEDLTDEYEIEDEDDGDWGIEL